MSQKRLADLTGHTDGYISQLETGSRGRRLDRDLVVGIAQALAAPVNELLVAAGHDPVAVDDGPSRFHAVVTADPLLRADQKKILAELYAVFVGRLA